MTQTARRALSAQKRLESAPGSDRFIDLQVDIVEADGTPVCRVGGRWDRRLKRYIGEGATARRLRLQPAQYEAARWMAGWLEAHVAGQPVREGGRAIRAVLFAGGRRGGKSDFAEDLAYVFAVLVPRSRVWIVVPAYTEIEEIELALKEKIPRKWYRWLGAPKYQFRLKNGSTITFRSAKDPEDLKKGRADFVVMNEAQKINARAYAIVRPATSDRRGLVVMTANPPDKPIGQWVADFVDETRAGRRPARYFHFNARLNPHADQESLDDMRFEVDERTYRMERDGEFLSRLDIAFHAWSPNLNVVSTPELGNVTREFTERKFGNEFDYISGWDFQLHPYMACVLYQAFTDPDEPENPFLWMVDYAAVKGHEDDLIDVLEERHYVGDRVACVVDASADWQDAERTRGRGSVDHMKKRKWSRIFLPDRKQKRNPQITERVAVSNARFCDATGKRHVYSDPQNLELNEALRKWEIKNGVPWRKSRFAHLCDGASYPLYRLYPRRKAPGAFTAEVMAREKRGGWEEM